MVTGVGVVVVVTGVLVFLVAVGDGVVVDSEYKRKERFRSFTNIQ